MSTAAILYRSSLNADCKPAGPATKWYPLPQDSLIQFAAYALTQDFEMRISPGLFPPAQKNTPSNFNNGAGFVFGGMGDANAILTSFSKPAPSGAGLGKFTATFMIVPASWDDFKTLPFTVPGWLGIIGTPTARDPRSYKVTTRLHRDYFLVDPGNLAAGAMDSSGAAINVVASTGAIPTIFKNYFFATIAGATQFNLFTDSLVPVAGVTIGPSVYSKTMPDTVAYQGWIANTQKTDGTGEWNTAAWNGKDLTQANVGQFVVDDSFLEYPGGNIVCRVTPYVLAK